MASKTSNEAVQALRRQQKAEETALLAVLGASGTVEQTRQRRAAELAALDAAVSEAEAGEDLALAVLGALMPADRAGRLAGVTPARMQQALRRAATDAVTGRLEALTGETAVVRRRGRPPGTGAPRQARRSGVRVEGGSATDDEHHDQQDGESGQSDADDRESPAASDDGAA
ncbi:hypothetical protein Q0Z83_110520 [Actinoplanes sichuanensis]|uniref:Integration host factor n=1 Tax=Actinoplanes sichuanensis TaxID=512349 RepID=A0ABW4A3B8_9ACTN|nr:hypothetical protein [Actinoplanes sichuanensis]BEL12861.1 hypothetical protein Q0Z83_110520 [Actinoplanes sichuanensis]